MENIEIIIARYNESLAWTLVSPFDKFSYTVYNKGDNESFEKSRVTKIINLPNVGRNDHTFLYHVITNYESIAPITVFLPGSVNIPYKLERATKILNKIIESNFTKACFIGYRTNNIRDKFYNFTIKKYTASDPQNFSKNPEHVLEPSKITPYGKWYQYFFNNIQVKYYTYGGVFSIDRRDILSNPIKKYQLLLTTLSTHSNPEAGHYVERSWAAIFHPFKYTPVSPELNGIEESTPHEILRLRKMNGMKKPAPVNIYRFKTT